jgi:aminopeptidase
MAVEPRVAEYAELLVERCLDVQPGWQVLIRSQPAARPVLEEMMRLIAGRGAFPLLRFRTSTRSRCRSTACGRPGAGGELGDGTERGRTREERLALVFGSENTRGARSRRPAPKLRQAYVGTADACHRLPWVGCLYPTEALAQEAGMTLADYADFVSAPACGTGTRRASACAGTRTASTPATPCASSAPAPI